MTRIAVKLAAEGLIDTAVLRRLLRESGLAAAEEYGLRGKHYLDRHLTGFNHAAGWAPWIVLRDFENDALCSGELARARIGNPAKYMVFRIAVQAVESWLIADRTAFAAEYDLPPGNVPRKPEGLLLPKEAVLRLLASSRKRAIRESMVRSGSGGKVEIGPEYNAMLSEFVATRWSPKAASSSSPSLAKAIARIDEFAEVLKREWGRS